MSASDDTEPKNHARSPTPPPMEEESQTPKKAEDGAAGVMRQLKSNDLFKKGSLVLRGLALLFSLISVIIMASNKHGDWKDFRRFEEYNYVLAIAILSSLYTGAQVLRQIQEHATGKYMILRRTASWIDFSGDQIMAYLLVSSASSAVPLTDRLREAKDLFSDSSSASISMSFLAFFCLAGSAMISGYKLSTQPYL
ncbi:hypothetical protein L6164_002426 [Bauhinia variegata]|uniref:Uncharacterized protein n=1 Tax=Bauhinia variegata TaxID=167791 RepID=A0ACB9Q008_BAUVA|nr:hypothetical protein L6164_002426 [Bauhinia variegata]